AGAALGVRGAGAWWGAFDVSRGPLLARAGASTLEERHRIFRAPGRRARLPRGGPRQRLPLAFPPRRGLDRGAHQARPAGVVGAEPPGDGHGGEREEGDHVGPYPPPRIESVSFASG